MNKVDLQNLITRINTKEDFTDSRDTVSWKALREAETFEDADIFPLLREIITENEGKVKVKREIRSAAYFIYGRLLGNNFHAEDCAFFLQQLTQETDKHIIEAMLEQIYHLRYSKILFPPELDISPIISFTRNDKWQVRHTAIRALSVCPGVASRNALIFYLTQEDEKAYKHEMYYANIAMQTIGEPEDIPLLERFLKSRRPDLKITAQCAIQYIREREATSFANH